MTKKSKVLILTAALLSGVVGAAQLEDTEARALAVLKESADYLSKAKSFRLAAELGFDVVQADGQTIEFGATRTVTIRRPDHAYAEGRRRDGDTSRFFFDGQVVTVSHPDQNAFASAKIPGTLDKTLDYLIDEVGVPMPLADLLYSDVYAVLSEHIEASVYVGVSNLGGVRCHHLAFRHPEADWQIWIEDGERPLPRRLVITYKTHEGTPQFRARLFDWDLAPEVPDSLFSFKPSPGAQQVPFVARTKPREGRR